MKKRGIVSSEVFVYVLTIVIVAVILVMGYRYIGSSKKIIDRGDLLQFRNRVISDIKSIGREFGAFKRISYSLPSNLEEVCFVDLGKKDDILSSKLISFYPSIKDSITSSLDKNVFFIGAVEISSVHVDGISISHYPFVNCFHQKNQKTNIGVGGLGGGKSQIIAEFKTKAKISEDDKTLLKSSDEVVTIEAAKGTQPNNAQISIEMIPPTAQFQQGASDVYKFEPTKVKFNPPVELRIKYNPSIVGECPSQLPFNQISDDGSRKTTLSESIDCKGKVAIFKIDEFI